MSLPFGLKRFIVSYVGDPIDVNFNPVLIGDKQITAKSRSSAWGKFCTQYFGALKPCPADYKVREVK